MADGVQTNLKLSFAEKHRLSNGEPVLTIRAAKGIYLVTTSLQPQPYSSRGAQGQPPTPDDDILVAQAASKKNFTLATRTPVEAEKVLPVSPE